MSAVPVYPVRVRGSLDPKLSRWLWLVKWLLAIPHYVVLAFLWLAFAVLTVVAFFGIVFTGRYPRSLFDFNAGVLRWTWRVAFYSYSALGTDRYPPFSLGEEPDYPARLEIPYPAQLSRGLALVKWWLLAIPHYLLLGVFVGGAGFIAWKWWGGGLISLLVLIAAVALLFTGAYPRGIFDFVLGLNRWALRVVAYAALMTDAYPPFRLDLGGDESGAVAVDSAPGTALGAGRIALLVVGGLFALVSLGLVAGGGTAVVVDQTQRDAAGYVNSPMEGYSTATYALVSERIEVALPGRDSLWRDLIGTVRISSQSDHPVFLGIARSDDAAAYLGTVRREEARDFADRASFRVLPGGAPAGAPAGQPFWVASASGTGGTSLTWEVSDGSWTAVLMNADGSAPVDANLALGAKLPGLLWAGVGVLAAGALLLGLAVLLIVLGARGRD